MRSRDIPRQQREMDVEPDAKGFDYGAGFTAVYSKDSPETEWMTGRSMEVRP